jgi:hypothetical protein
MSPDFGGVLAGHLPPVIAWRVCAREIIGEACPAGLILAAQRVMTRQADGASAIS